MVLIVDGQSASKLAGRAAEQGSRLLSVIARHPGTSRASLSEVLGLSRSSITKRVDELIGVGLVSERIGASVGGRPPLELTLDAGAGVLLAADLGATHCAVAITDVAGRPLAESTWQLDIADGPEPTLQALATRFADLLQAIGRNEHDVIALGIGVPGPVEHLTGTVIRPPIMPGWDGYNVPGFFVDRYDAPVLVDNDVNLAALGEYWLRGAAAEQLLYVKISTGIGCGIVSGGVLHRGAEGAAGDIGHIRVAGASELVCVCGNVGCLEAVAGGDALSRRLRDAGLPDVHHVRDVARLALEGNRTARRAVLEAADEIGQVLASLVSFYNPNAIVIGGPLADVNEDVLAAVRTAIYRRALPLATRALTVERSQNGDRVGRIGARALALEYVLSPAGVHRLLARASR